VVEKSAVEGVVELVAEPSATTHEEQIYIKLMQHTEDKPRPSLVDTSEEAAAVESVQDISAEQTAQTQQDQVLLNN